MYFYWNVVPSVAWAMNFLFILSSLGGATDIVSIKMPLNIAILFQKSKYILFCYIFWHSMINDNLNIIA